MPLNRNIQTRGFAIVTTPDDVINELLKLNNIQFRENNLVFEAARSEVKATKTIAKLNHTIRPQVVVNRSPENQDVFNRSKLVNNGKLKTLPGSDSREILHYVNSALESGNYDSAVLHFGVNDLM